MAESKFFLFDGMALLYRAHFAFSKNPLLNLDKENISGLYGLANFICDIKLKEKPDYMALALDTSAPTQRHTDFPAYKAQREAMPDDLRLCIKLAIELAEVLDMPLLRRDGYEADDLICSVANQISQKNEDIQFYMVTPDKDFAQCVTDNISLWRPSKGKVVAEVMDVADVCAKWQIEEPRQLIDILALAGDAADNIPGVAGIGEKTAIKLVDEYKSVEGVVANIDKLKGKQQENVAAQKDQLALYKKLVTIWTDIEVDLDLNSYRLNPVDAKPIAEFCHQQGFKQLTNKLLEFAEESTRAEALDSVKPVKVNNFESRQTNYQSLNCENFDAQTLDKQLQLFLKKASEQAILFKQPKHLSLAPIWEQSPHANEAPQEALKRLNIESALLGLAISISPRQSLYLHKPNLSVCLLLIEWAKNQQAALVGYHLKGFVSYLAYWAKLDEASFPNLPVLFDVHLAQQLLEPETPKPQQVLPALVEKHCDYHMLDPGSIELQKPDLQASQASSLNLFEGATDDAAPLIWDTQTLAKLSGEKSDLMLDLKLQLTEKIQSTKLDRVFYHIEMPLIQVLASMENQGISLNLSILDELKSEILIKLESDSAAIHSYSDEELNLNSPKQLGFFLFDQLGIEPKPKKTKTGQYSTNEAVLQSLKNVHPVIPAILDYREYQKLLSTYVEALPKHIHPKTQRVHAHFHQLLASTGRLSCSDPNLQNIPMRTELGRRVRQAFIANHTDHQLLSIDYSQIELRVMAALSGDASLKDAFVQGKDIHTATAAKIYQVDDDLVTGDMRRQAKVVNFGILYGISAFGLTQRLDGLALKDAKELIDTYWQAFPAVKTCLDELLVKARETGYVQTYWGRKRYLPQINASNGMDRKIAERAAINMPIQGTAADMMKMAMIDIHKYIEENQCKSQLLLQVHDELIFDLHPDEAKTLPQVLAKIMEESMLLPNDIPIKAEFGMGINWLEAH